jgi:hypothetical protein
LGSIEVNLKVHSSTGAYAVSFMADGNYQSKNFFTNILRTHLESKFNFATFETFIGPNCVKVCDKVHTEKEIDEKVNKRNNQYHNKTEEWKKRKSDHEKIVDEEV